MGRVNVFLRDELLEAIDAEAKESGINRSALIQLAMTSFLDARRREREEAKRRQEMDEAARGIDALAEKLGAWDPVRIIREFRDNPAFQVAERTAPKPPKPSKRGKTPV